MKSFSELAQSKGYWLTKIQNDLYNTVEDYLEAHHMTRTQLASKLGVSKGYVSQVLNGDFDHRLSKLIELSLAVGVVPNLKFQPTDEYVENYTNGYDFCINAAQVTTTIVVNNTTALPTIPRAFDPERDASHLVDQESSVFYSMDTNYKFQEVYA